MSEKKVKEIFDQIRNEEISDEEAMLKLRLMPFEDIGFAKVDHHRELRQGAAEIIYGAGKTPEQISEIADVMKKGGQDAILITRLSGESAEIIQKSQPLEYFPQGRLGVIGKFPKPDCNGKIVVATGGTSDITVAEEAAITAEFLANKVERIYDVGVSGLHRLLARIEDLMSADVVIAVAGMEGALASVIGGLADCPVIAVPTSIGYGASFSGLSALLSMLNSCASGVSVVNIDNGFGAGYLASMINHKGEKR